MACSEIPHNPPKKVPVRQEEHRCHNNPLKLYPETLHDSLKYFPLNKDDKTARFCQYSLCGIIMHQGVL